ncbi:MAG: polysaccharide deacetylase family protein [Pseudonocardiales bacterium]|jgi:peptidoglycan/xylan/chitin deacetylase (PgdA/CDA1 family)|nr:polysaccharide deacetylase family protein [Pseudonocardiales bacterium]MBV9650376.1 polysaccharide deacetylase family protein [Pseudonocardiales bacterium]
MSEAIPHIRPDKFPNQYGDGPLPPVLMYHSVAPYEHDPYLVTVHPARFTQQLRWLHRRGLRGTSMRELLAARRAGVDRGLVGLTFDDGYADFIEHVLPALARFGFTATVFVIADLLGESNKWDAAGPRKPLMTVDQIRHVAQLGMEIGSHSRRHVSLTSLTSPCDLIGEVSESRTILEDLTGERIVGFCYPYGHLNALAVAAVRAAGYQYGCAIWRSPLTSVHALPRIYVGDRDGPLRLRAKWYRRRYRECLRYSH